MNTPSKQALFRIEDLGEKAAASIVEAIERRQKELYEMAERIIVTTPPEKAPILRAGFSMKIDLRTSTVSFEFSGNLKWKSKSAIQVLSQRTLEFQPTKITPVADVVGE